MMEIMGCPYKTPCGWCRRRDKECTEKDSPKKTLKAAAMPAEEKLLNPVGEYAIKFAKNHGMSISEAMEHPMVKAYAAAQAGFKSGLINC